MTGQRRKDQNNVLGTQDPNVEEQKFKALDQLKSSGQPYIEDIDDIASLSGGKAYGKKRLAPNLLDEPSR